ncbi:hypothetical protein LIER_32755 [Lithospermum erythrorhizon]|uniref:Cyclin-dependent kinase inhibitor domain-containing protein n=1 Tax=Lithospermum erythrorhizon TaxID=34254 RepID=A0AAV3RW30_LITER
MVKRERRGDTEEILKGNANDDGQELWLKRRRLHNSTTFSTEPDNSDDPSSSSCCSSHVSSESSKEKLITKALQEVCSGGDEMARSATFIIQQTENKETKPVSKLESTTMPPSLVNSLARKPSDDELQEFFSTAERKLHKQFSKKYNFDFNKEEPLEGRYQWVQVKP